MARTDPAAELDRRYSSDGATATTWSQASGRLEQAQLFWLATVRPEGGPHVTPLLAVWQDDRLHFCTGAGERKAMNLALNPRCALITGCNTLDEGLDVVVEGEAVRVTDDERLRRLADAWVAKYGEEWRFGVGDGGFVHEAGDALVFEIAPTRGFGFGRGEEYSQTRWALG
jgi:nitroimidazol reductase NimA-like FMN-containing flavoprotein (pyridoxamine 5'-phosphate oxidase superfamily)